MAEVWARRIRRFLRSGSKRSGGSKQPLDRVIHTLGWPLPTDAFGGSFIYPQGPNEVALGLVVGLDYHDAHLDVHELLQRLKLHPLVQDILEGGTLLEWGAKTIPEGGWYALPERRSWRRPDDRRRCGRVRRCAVAQGHPLRDAIGDLCGADSIRGDQERGHLRGGLAGYDTLVNASYIATDLYRTRNMRLGFKSGFYLGGVKAGLMTITGGRFPGGKIAMHADAEQARARSTDTSAFVPDNELTFSKLDAVFKSGNATRDTIPSHLIVGQDISPEMADFYSHVCPAGVYERVGDELRVNPPNCVDCKATDVLGPRWTPREGGSGPRYRGM